MADMTEAQAIANIREWSEKLPGWQRDALRRLYAEDAPLEEADLNELTNLCKSKCKDNGKSEGCVPFAAEHTRAPEDAKATVKLRGICDVKNVNALTPDQCLTFGKLGLTVVYGNNGSGKSGYARILKQVCRSRASEKNIFANVHEEEEKQKATIDFSVGGEDKEHIWPNDDNPNLSLISIFDSSAANVHITKENDVAYTPFPLRLLERLAEACDEVKRRIQEEIKHLEGRTPDWSKRPPFHAGTKVYELITKLSHKTKKQAVRDLAELREEDKKRLNDRSSDPIKMARPLEKQKRNIGELDKAFKALEMAVSDEQFKRLKDLHKEYQTAREAATVTAGKLFADEPLPDIGSDVWCKLWEAARTYSKEKAYKSKPFPFTEEGALCPLCLQELGTEAASRFTRFDDFVRNETKMKEEQATEDYNAVRGKLKEDFVKLGAFISFVRNELDNGALAESIRPAAVTLRRRGRAILRDHTKDGQALLPGAEAWPTQAIEEHIEALSRRISELRSEDGSEERKRMHQELKELKDREWLEKRQEDVIAEIGHLGEQDKLKAASKDAAKNRITSKIDKIAEKLVSKKLRDQFSKEFEQFNSTGLKIEMHTTASLGASRSKIILNGNPDISVGDILSEGEKRCVALAVFLAELATTENKSAIVFDDPISSLDHDHRTEVAKRLAEERKHRQVIVLTHDIVFLNALRWECKEGLVSYCSVIRVEDNVGVVRNELPMRTRPVKDVIKEMRKRLKKGKKPDKLNKWEETAKDLEVRLRPTWELAVEEVISPVLMRLTDRITPRDLIKLTVLDENDCGIMNAARERLNSLYHSKALSVSQKTPSPGELEEEINELENWLDCIKRRQKAIKTQYNKQASAGELGDHA